MEIDEREKNQKLKKKKSKFISIIQYIIIIFMVIFNVVFITKAIKNPNKTPDFFNIKTFVIVSGSMTPNINIGDMVVIKVEENTQYAVRRYYSF